MTQDNILVSLTLSACLKPGSVCRIRISNLALQTSPSFRPSGSGDTDVISADLPRLTSILLTSFRPFSLCALRALHRGLGVVPTRNQKLVFGSHFSRQPLRSLRPPSRSDASINSSDLRKAIFPRSPFRYVAISLNPQPSTLNPCGPHLPLELSLFNAS
jgi:hypothetical protein